MHCLMQNGEGCTGGESQSLTDIPVTPQQLTVGWVASVMGVPILDARVQRCSSMGGFASEAYRMQLVYKEIGSSTEEVVANTQRLNYPTSAVIKLSSGSIDFRQHTGDATALGVYATEFFMYTQLHPKLMPARVPRIYGCFPDDSDEVTQLTLVMEDLSAPDAFGQGGEVPAF